MVLISLFSIPLLFLILFATVFGLTVLLIFRKIMYEFFTRGAPYVPTGKEEIKTMSSFAKKYNCSYAADLGSGTGEICFAFADNGIKTDGYEINPILVFISQIRNIFKKNKVRFYVRNFWKTDLSKYDCIAVFGIGYIMSDLEKKLRKEIVKETVIISHRFAFPGLKAIDNRGKVHVYKISP
jgi:hypothetical protein